MTANTCSRDADVRGGSTRVNDTRHESTPGTGQNTVRGTGPARRIRADQASLAEDTPYSRLPGGAHILAPTSACTMTRPCRSDGHRASTLSSTGTVALYGRLATSTVGGSPGSSRMRAASAVTTSSRPARPGARAATVAGSAAASTRSISTATTRRATSSSGRVSEPKPGPTSRTTSLGPQAGQRDDPPYRAVVDDEVLAEPLGRAHPQPRGQVPDLGRPQQPCVHHGSGHHGPKMRSPVAVTSAQSSATSMFFTSARRRAV